MSKQEGAWRQRPSGYAFGAGQARRNDRWEESCAELHL
jgi:hypothetical protein